MSTAKTRKLLSKSKYISGLQCQKRLWLEIYRPELAAATAPATQAMFDAGTEVGELARGLYPAGVLVDEPYYEHDAAVARTQQLMQDRNVGVIFEAAFTFDGIRVRADILVRQPRNRWLLLEVKASAEFKPAKFHDHDLAIQAHVLRGCGVKLAGCGIVHLNTDYVYPGGDYDLSKLFTTTMLDDELTAAAAAVPGNLEQMWKTLRKRKAPDIAPGTHCKEPYDCPFKHVCHADVADDHPCNLANLRGKRLQAIEDAGIESIADIPDDMLTATQRLTVEAYRRGGLYIHEPEQLAHTLATLQYPVFYLDFETINPALPIWPNTRPYENVPFQFSLHVQQRPGGKLKHYEYLADATGDPRPELVKQLLAAFADIEGAAAGSNGRSGRNGNAVNGNGVARRNGNGANVNGLAGRNGKSAAGGSVVVYYAPFERSVLENLAIAFPRQAKSLGAIKDRLWDLCEVVRDHVFHPSTNGHNSLKAVVPVLTDLSHDDLDIADGEAASLAFEKLMTNDPTDEQRDDTLAALQKYCYVDTYTMDRSLAKLLADVSEGEPDPSYETGDG